MKRVFAVLFLVLAFAGTVRADSYTVSATAYGFLGLGAFGHLWTNGSAIGGSLEGTLPAFDTSQGTLTGVGIGASGFGMLGYTLSDSLPFTEVWGTLSESGRFDVLVGAFPLLGTGGFNTTGFVSEEAALGPLPGPDGPQIFVTPVNSNLTGSGSVAVVALSAFSGGGDIGFVCTPTFGATYTVTAYSNLFAAEPPPYVGNFNFAIVGCTVSITYDYASPESPGHGYGPPVEVQITLPNPPSLPPPALGTSPPEVNDPQFWSYYLPQPVPEPASLLLLGTGLVGLARWRKRRT